MATEGQFKICALTQSQYDSICDRDQSDLRPSKLTYCAMADSVGFLVFGSEAHWKDTDLIVATFLRKVFSLNLLLFVPRVLLVLWYRYFTKPCQKD